MHAAGHDQATPDALQARRGLAGVTGLIQRRHLLMPAILLVHLVLLGLIALAPPALVAPAAETPLSVFDVMAAAPEPSPPKPRPQPPEPVLLPPPLIELALDVPPLPAPPVFDAMAAERAGFGKTCDVADTLARAFTENEVLKAELLRIGPKSRSVANAIMFWDRQWVEVPGGAPQDALDLLRRAILEGVRAAPAECRAQEIAGPRFISVGGGVASTMLVLGSGAWRWEDLLAESSEQQPGTRTDNDDAAVQRRRM